MKTISVPRWLFLGLLLSAAACGDDGGTTGPASDADVAGLEDVPVAELGQVARMHDLDEEDRAAMRAALRAAHEAIRAIRERLRAGEITPEQARAEAGAVHDALLQALSEVLTEEQIERLLRRRGAGPGPLPGPPLDLTDEQIAAIRELQQAFREFARESRAAVESGELTAQEARRRLREEAQATRAAVCDVLSEEQQAQVRFCSG